MSLNSYLCNYLEPCHCSQLTSGNHDPVQKAEIMGEVTSRNTVVALLAFWHPKALLNQEEGLQLPSTKVTQLSWLYPFSLPLACQAEGLSQSLVASGN